MACFRNQIDIAGIWDDGIQPGTFVHGIRVMGGLEELCSSPQAYPLVIALGRPELRSKVYHRLKEAGHHFPTLIHNRAYVGDASRIRLGEGVVIFPEAVLTADIVIGANTLIHVGCSLHHDFEAGKHCMIMPGSRFTGGAKLGDEVFIPPGTILAGPERIEGS